MIGMNGPPAFGVDVEHLAPGGTVTVDAKADGFPFGLDRLPAGDYTVQAVLIPYTRAKRADRSEEHTSELQSLMRISYAVFCLTTKKQISTTHQQQKHAQH